MMQVIHDLFVQWHFDPRRLVIMSCPFWQLLPLMAKVLIWEYCHDDDDDDDDHDNDIMQEKHHDTITNNEQSTSSYFEPIAQLEGHDEVYWQVVDVIRLFGYGNASYPVQLVVWSRLTWMTVKHLNVWLCCRDTMGMLSRLPLVHRTISGGGGGNIGECKL